MTSFLNVCNRFTIPQFFEATRENKRHIKKSLKAGFYGKIATKSKFGNFS